MDTVRLFERIREYKEALARFREALAAEETDLIRDAIIQRFEFTYELAWKALKLWLGFRNVEVKYPREAFTEGLQQGLIQDGNGWSELQKMRNQTSHTYNKATALKVVTFLRGEGIRLFDDLEKRFMEVTEK